MLLSAWSYLNKRKQVYTEPPRKGLLKVAFCSQVRDIPSFCISSMVPYFIMFSVSKLCSLWLHLMTEQQNTHVCTHYPHTSSGDSETCSFTLARQVVKGKNTHSHLTKLLMFLLSGMVTEELQLLPGVLGLCAVLAVLSSYASPRKYLYWFPYKQGEMLLHSMIWDETRCREKQNTSSMRTEFHHS